MRFAVAAAVCWFVPWRVAVVPAVLRCCGALRLRWCASECSSGCGAAVLCCCCGAVVVVVCKRVCCCCAVLLRCRGAAVLRFQYFHWFREMNWLARGTSAASRLAIAPGDLRTPVYAAVDSLFSLGIHSNKSPGWIL